MSLRDRLNKMQEEARFREGEFANLPARAQEKKTLPLPEKAEAETAEERAKLAGGLAGFDCETFLIQPGRATPRLVVTGYQNNKGEQRIVTGDADDPTAHARAFLEFTSAGQFLVNHNFPFDFCVLAEDAHQADVKLGLVGMTDSWFDRVMRQIFKILDQDLVEDTMLRERLLDIAEGVLGKDQTSLTEAGKPRRKKYTLQALAKTYLDVEMDKTTWRMGYAQYLNKPISEYPEGAQKYVLEDVEHALHTAQRQQRRAETEGLDKGQRLPNSAEQAKAGFAFGLMSSWGMRTDELKVEQFAAELEAQKKKLLPMLLEAGFVRNVGSRDLEQIRKAVEKAYKEQGLAVPTTEKGSTSTAGSAIEDIALIRTRGDSHDKYDEKGQLVEDDLFKDPLYALSQYVSIEKLEKTYLKALRDGTARPINARYQVLVETGRTSCSSPNLQNLPRGGKKTLLQRLQSRVRECFVPRPGYVFCSVDYNIAELCALAQVCVWLFGEARLADAINKNVDPHLLLAAEQLLGIDYEHAVKNKKDPKIADMRQLAKSANFGFPGGLGVNSFLEFAKNSYGVFLTFEQAKDLKERWFSAWPEMRQYFKKINLMMNRGTDDFGQPVGDIEAYVSGRIRGRTRYCAAANYLFQGLVADATKRAVYEIQRESYLQGGRMYGSRLVAMIHDETIAEVPRDVAHEHAMVQAEIMVRVFQEMCPDVKIRAEPALMDCWLKGAEAVYDKDGRLTVWKQK